MPQTLIQSDGLAPGCITRAKLNTTLAASAVIAKVLAGAGIALSYTGVDSGTGDVTVTGLPTAIPTGGNGWYLPATNTLGVATNNLQRGTISSAGNWTINAPTSTSSTVGGYGLTVSAPGNGSASFGFLVIGGTSGSDLAVQVLNAATTLDLFSVAGNGVISLPSVATTTTAPAAGGAGAMSLFPKGYFSMTIGSYAAKIPYY